MRKVLIGTIVPRFCKFGFEEFARVGWRQRKEFCVKLESPELDFNVAKSRNLGLLCSSYDSKIDSNKLEMLVS